MAQEWFFRNSPQPYGPYTPGQLRKFVIQGHIRPDTLIRKGQEGDWVSASQIQGLLPRLADLIAIEESSEEPEKPTKTNSVALRIITGSLGFMCLIGGLVLVSGSNQANAPDKIQEGLTEEEQAEIDQFKKEYDDLLIEYEADLEIQLELNREMFPDETYKIKNPLWRMKFKHNNRVKELNIKIRCKNDHLERVKALYEKYGLDTSGETFEPMEYVEYIDTSEYFDAR